MYMKITTIVAISLAFGIFFTTLWLFDKFVKNIFKAVCLLHRGGFQ